MQSLNGFAITKLDYYNNPGNDGHIKISVINVSSSKQIIENNERIAQGIFVKYLTTEDDNTNKIREGGIGSTDIVDSRERSNSTQSWLTLF